MEQEKEQKARTTGSKDFWLQLWEIFKPSRKQIKALLLLIVVFRLAQLAAPYILKLIIDRLANFSPEQIIPLLLFIAIFFLSEQLTSILSYFKDKKTFSILVDAEYYLPTRIQGKLVNLSLDYHERENTGNKITKTERGVYKIIELMANMAFEVIPTLVQLLVTLLALLVLDWRIGLSFAFFSPLFIAVTYKVNRSLYPLRKKGTRDTKSLPGRWGNQ